MIKGENNRMDWKNLFRSDEKPLERLVPDGGFAAIFRTIACIGDSLASGEFVSIDDERHVGFHDMYDYSWGQFMARTLGCTVFNFSRGGMTAREYVTTFADQQNFWATSKAAQAYILALGINDITEAIQNNTDLGSTADITPNYWDNGKTFAGYYASIVQRLKTLQPNAKFFFMTIPVSDSEGRRLELEEQHAALLYDLAAMLGNAYVMDFRKYAPEYDEEFRDKFYMTGHMTPCGYRLTAQMVMSYLDWIIRHHMDDFRKVGFIGTPYINVDYR